MSFSSGQAKLSVIYLCPYPGGGHSLIWPRQICAAEYAMVFKVPNRVYNFTISSSTGCVFGPEAFISETVIILV